MAKLVSILFFCLACLSGGYTRAINFTPPDFTTSPVPKRRALGDINELRRPVPDDCPVVVKARRPRFSESTYQNAQLARGYAEFQARSGDIFHALEVVTSTLDTMTSVRRVEDTASYRLMNVKGVLQYDEARYLAMLGKFKEAKKAARRARGTLTSNHMKVDSNLKKFYKNYLKAVIAHNKGQYQKADSLVLEAIQAWAKVGWTRAPILMEFETLLLFRAENYLAMNQPIQAEIKARKSIKGLYSDHGFSTQTAGAVEMLAKALLERGKVRDAKELAITSINMHEAKCADQGSLNLSNARITLASILIINNATEALKEVEKVQTHLDSGLLERFFRTRVDWALTLALAGNVKKAMKWTEAAIERAERQYGSESYLVQELHAVLAITLLRSGQEPRAERHISQAIWKLSDLRQQQYGSFGFTRNSRFRIYVEEYLKLLDRRASSPQSVEDSFQLAQVFQNQSVHHAIMSSSLRAAAENKKIASLIVKQQAKQQERQALENVLANLSSVPVANIDEQELKEIHKQIGGINQELQKLNLELEKKDPSFSNLIHPKPAATSELMHSLNPDEALILIYPGIEQTYLWAVSGSNDISYSSVKVNQKDLYQMIQELRTPFDTAIYSLDDVLPFDTELAFRLYQTILEPVKPGWNNAQNIIIVAHDQVGALPMATLMKSKAESQAELDLLFSEYKDLDWFIKDHAVALVPSVSSLVHLRATKRSDPAQEPFVGFGDPWFNQHQAQEAVAVVPNSGTTMRGLTSMRSGSDATLEDLPRLPGTSEEIQYIATALSADVKRDAYLGDRASEKNVKNLDLSDTNVIAFATHGLVSGDLDGLDQPALALSAPSVVGGNEDGLLKMEEILGLKLNAEWVVLSACNTAAASHSGAETLSGLGRAFIYAGAKSLLLTHWPVETTSAQTLTTGVFSQVSSGVNQYKSDALRKTQLNMIREGTFLGRNNEPMFSYAHPIFWAPFTVVGDSM